MSTSTEQLAALKDAALAQGFEWGDLEWREGHFKDQIIVAMTDRAPISKPMWEGPAKLRQEKIVQVDGRKYAIAKHFEFGVLFAHIDG